MKAGEASLPTTLIGLVCTARRSEANPHAHNNVGRVLRSIGRNESDFAVTRDFDRASYILVVGSGTRFYYDLICSPIYRTHSGKIFVLDFSDNTVPIIPGLYMSLGPNPDSSRFKQNFYLRVAESPALEVLSTVEPRYLAWFRGNAATHPIRRRVTQLKDDAFSIEDRDTQMNTDESYARDLQGGKFILCPRGLAASSVRQFEAMRLGRVPVVISDEWVEPPNVRWADCMVRVAEADIERLPQILRAREAEWPQMAAAARAVWEANFSMNSSIRWIDAVVKEIAAARKRTADRFSFTRTCYAVARRGFLPHWLREVMRVKTGERTVYMARQSEWVFSP